MLPVRYNYVMSGTTHISTAEQLFAANLHHCELIGGELVMMSPAGFDHGRFASKIVAALGIYAAQRKSGVVTTAETGFQIAADPDTVRSPDVAYVRAERVPSGGVKGFFPGAPDLAVEIISPSDRTHEIAAKAQEWLRAGCRSVWVVDPERHSVTVRCSGGQLTILTASDTLIDSGLLPDFSMPVAEIFA